MSNALRYTKNLEKVNLTSEQAFMITNNMVEFVEENFVTKSDLQINRIQLENKMDSIAFNLDRKIDTVAATLNHKIDEVAVTLNNKIDTVAETLNNKIDTVAATLNHRIDQVEMKLDSKIDNLHDKIIIKIGGMIGFATAILGTGIGIIIYMK